MLRPESGVFAGVLPSDVVVANTATRWSGKLWTMLMWQSIGRRPVQQRRLLMHESFHRIQAELGLPATNANNPHLDSLEEVDRETSFVRGFAYLSGPAYGLLLDASDPGWRHGYRASSDLAATLAAAAKLVPAADPEARARFYDDGALRASEEERARLQAERVAAYRARLVEGPVLVIPLEAARYGFDPDSVVALGEAGTSARHRRTSLRRSGRSSALPSTGRAGACRQTGSDLTVCRPERGAVRPQSDPRRRHHSSARCQTGPAAGRQGLEALAPL